MIALGELEQDALTEIFNIGVGVAADAIYQIGGEHVPLSVPVVELTSQHRAKQQFMAREQRALYAIRQIYRGEFNTDAVLLFPEESSASLVRLMVGTDVSVAQVTEMAQDAMSELGNIVLNAVISNLSSTLHIPLEGSLPDVSLLKPEQIFTQHGKVSDASADETPVLALMVDFVLSTGNVSGYLVFLLDENSSKKLCVRLTQYVSAAPD